MAADTTQVIHDELLKLSTGLDPDLIINIAKQIELDWFLLIIKVIMVAVSLLLIRHLIRSLTFYIRLRFDKYVRVGDMIRYNGNIVGRIKTYNLNSVVIETNDGYVRVPLSIWHSTHWTILKHIGNDFATLNKQKNMLKNCIAELDVQAETLQTKINEATKYLKEINKNVESDADIQKE